MFPQGYHVLKAWDPVQPCQVWDFWELRAVSLLVSTPVLGSCGVEVTEDLFKDPL